MDRKKYDEYGRPIKKESFFSNFSKPKKREYNYKKEEKEDNHKKDPIEKFDELIINDGGEKTIDLESSIDENIENNSNELENLEEFDVSKYPIFLIYLFVFIMGFLGLFISILLLHLFQKKIKGIKKLIFHLVIAFLIYFFFQILFSFYLNFYN